MKTRVQAFTSNAFMKACLMLLLAVSAVTTTASASDINWGQPGPESATVIGRTPGGLAQDLQDVQIIAINGQNLPGGRDVIWLQPGRYDLEVRFLVRDTGAGLGRASSHRSDNTIELVVEAGKRYILAGRRDARGGRNGFSVVVHRIEPSDPSD